MGYAVYENKGKWGLKFNLKTILDAKYDRIIPDFQYGFYIEQNGKFGYYASKLKRIILKPSFEQIRHLDLLQLMYSDIERTRSSYNYKNVLSRLRMKKGVSFNLLEFTFGNNYGLIHIQSGRSFGIFEKNESSGLLPLTFDTDEVHFIYTIDDIYMNVIDRFGKNCIPVNKYIHNEEFVGKNMFLEYDGKFDYFNSKFEKLNQKPITNFFDLDESGINVLLIEIMGNWELRKRNFELIKTFKQKRKYFQPTIINDRIFVSNNDLIGIYDKNGHQIFDHNIESFLIIDNYSDTSLLKLQIEGQSGIYSVKRNKLIIGLDEGIFKLTGIKNNGEIINGCSIIQISNDNRIKLTLLVSDYKTKILYSGELADISLKRKNKYDVEFNLKEEWTFKISYDDLKSSTFLSEFISSTNSK